MNIYGRILLRPERSSAARRCACSLSHYRGRLSYVLRILPILCDPYKLTYVTVCTFLYDVFLNIMLLYHVIHYM